MICSVFVAHEWENPLHANHYSELIIYKPIYLLRKSLCPFAVCGGFGGFFVVVVVFFNI